MTTYSIHLECSKNIIHRDIKPANIVLLHQNDKNIYKLADFGAARFLKPNETYGSLYGTYEYMHPNIFANFYRRALDVSVPKPVFNDTYELWPLGVMFFEAASGRLPFEPEKGRDDAKAMYQMIANKEANFISAKQVDGRIEWSSQLPENCDLDDSLKEVITPLLAALLQVNIFFMYISTTCLRCFNMIFCSIDIGIASLTMINHFFFIIFLVIEYVDI